MISVPDDIKVRTTATENKYKWSDRQVELLISEWAKEPCLYDANHEDYTKYDKRLNIERQIVAALNENVCHPEERLLTGKIHMKYDTCINYKMTLYYNKHIIISKSVRTYIAACTLDVHTCTFPKKITLIKIVKKGL